MKPEYTELIRITTLAAISIAFAALMFAAQ